MKKLLGVLGLCMRAGKLKSGGVQAEESIRKKKAVLVLLASDASENTKKHFTELGTALKIPVLEIADKEALGKCIGKEERSVLTVTDESFRTMIQKEISKLTEVTNP